MTLFQKGARAVVLAALGVIEGVLIGKIKSLIVQNSLRSSLEPVRSMALALTDDNPKDAEQVETIWQNYLNAKAPDLVNSESQRLIASLKGENLKKVLTTLVVPISQSLQIVSDENPDNDTQLKEYFAAFFNREDVQDVAFDAILVPLITKKIKDENLRTMVLAMLQGLDDING